MGFTRAADDGIGLDADFISELRTNMDVFSAFRTHRTQTDIAGLMVTADGQLKSFTKFVKDAQPYLKHKNRAWLQTEYDTAVIRAHAAVQWKQFEREADVLPNLRWLPSTSVTPRADHRVFWGTVRPINDAFWVQHRPGDNWNCKCGIESTDDDATPVPTDVDVENEKPAKGLENNPANDGRVFSEKHKYYPSGCGACPFASGGKKLWALVGDLVGMDRKMDCAKCRAMLLARKINIAKKEYLSYSEDVYERILFNNSNGGFFGCKQDAN